MVRRASGSEADIRDDTTEVTAIVIDGRQRSHLPVEVFAQIRTGDPAIEIVTSLEDWMPSGIMTVARTTNGWRWCETSRGSRLVTCVCEKQAEVAEEILRRVQAFDNRGDILVVTSSQELADRCRALGARVYSKGDELEMANGENVTAGQIFLIGTELVPAGAANEYEVHVNGVDSRCRVYDNTAPRSADDIQKAIAEANAECEEAAAVRNWGRIGELGLKINDLTAELKRTQEAEAGEGGIDLAKLYSVKVEKTGDGALNIMLTAPASNTYVPIHLAAFNGAGRPGNMFPVAYQSRGSIDTQDIDWDKAEEWGVAVVQCTDFSVATLDKNGNPVVTWWSNKPFDHTNNLMVAATARIDNSSGEPVCRHPFIKMARRAVSDRDEGGGRVKEVLVPAKNGTAGEDVAHRPLAELKNGNGAERVSKKAVTRDHDATDEDEGADPPKRGRRKKAATTAAK